MRKIPIFVNIISIYVFSILLIDINKSLWDTRSMGLRFALYFNNITALGEISAHFDDNTNHNDIIK